MKNLLKVIYRNLIYIFYGDGLSFVTKLQLKIKKRFQQSSISFFGKDFTYSDSSSFVSTYEEIFIKKIYDFPSDIASPYILDCGANIGLSTIAFKRQHPKARIKAFEPDSTISEILKDNLAKQQYQDVEVIPKALWVFDGEIKFHEQGGLSGSIVDGNTNGLPIVSLPCIRLKDLLTEKIDFLKIDIEGAEYDVLCDCKDQLIHVQRMFVEYHSVFSKKQTLNEILKIISDAGFRYHIQEAYTSPQPFMHVTGMQDMDLQLNIFCYR